MGIKYQFRLKILFTVFRVMNLYPTCRLLRIRKISPLVLGTWLLHGSSSSCTWRYCPHWRCRCFLSSRVLTDMMVFGLRLSEIPPLVGNKFSILTKLITMWVVKRFGIRCNGRPFQMAIHRSFTNLICRSISGTCLFDASIFTSGTPGRDSINYPFVCTFFMQKPLCE